jgi:hypothetical protein
MPGTMISTMADATMMYAWSPDWNHLFRFSRPVGKRYELQNRHVGNCFEGSYLNLLRLQHWW